MPSRSLQRILQSQGFGTRRQCRALVRRGGVTVEGGRAEDPERIYESEGLEIDVDGVMEWRCRERLHLALNKPPGYECSRNPSHHPSVASLLPAPFVTRGVQPVGRLDQDASGLLLLSDDGAFNHAISSPKRHVSKTYLATTSAPATDDLVGRLRTGVQLRGEAAPIAALSCALVGAHQIEIRIEQGKYHQVKRMLAAAGAKCVGLERTAIGGLTLVGLGLEPAAWCVLGEAEIARLRSGDGALRRSERR